MPSRSPAPGALTATASMTASTELFVALGRVIKRLRRHPLPDQELLRAAFQHGAPAPRHIAALVHVATDGPIGMTDLADQLSISLATASQVVTDLADWGLVERAVDPTDRRRTFVAVAPQHAATIRALLDSRLRPLERTLRRLDPDEGAAFVRGLDMLAEELDAHERTS